MKEKLGKYIGKDVSGRRIYFGKKDKIADIHNKASIFLENIFNIEIVFLSNYSSLSDFATSEREINKAVRRIKARYGVDISHIKEKPIFEIVRFVLKNSR